LKNRIEISQHGFLTIFKANDKVIENIWQITELHLYMQLVYKASQWVGIILSSVQNREPFLKAKETFILGVG
jgi:hypothetical protein